MLYEVITGALNGLSRTIGLGLANGGLAIPGNTEHRPLIGAGLIPGTPGANGSKGAGLDIIGSQSGKTGIYALRDVDLFNILCIPETRDLPETEANAVIAAAASLCVITSYSIHYTKLYEGTSDKKDVVEKPRE